jgi:hypothetical protein
MFAHNRCSSHFALLHLAQYLKSRQRLAACSWHQRHPHQLQEHMLVCFVGWTHAMRLQETMYADVYQDVGGQLTPEEAAAVARWRAATGGAAAQQAAAAAEPWVTEQQLKETGMLDNPYYVQVRVTPALKAGALRIVLSCITFSALHRFGRRQVLGPCSERLQCCVDSVCVLTAVGCLPYTKHARMYKCTPTKWFSYTVEGNVRHMTPLSTRHCFVPLQMLHSQVGLGGTEYGRFGTRIQKQMTKAFFPRIHEALKPVAEANLGMSEEEIDEEGEC